MRPGGCRPRPARWRSRWRSGRPGWCPGCRSRRQCRRSRPRWPRDRWSRRPRRRRSSWCPTRRCCCRCRRRRCRSSSRHVLVVRVRRRRRRGVGRGVPVVAGASVAGGSLGAGSAVRDRWRPADRRRRGVGRGISGRRARRRRLRDGVRCRRRGIVGVGATTEDDHRREAHSRSDEQPDPVMMTSEQHQLLPRFGP